MSYILHVKVLFLDPVPAIHGKRDGGVPEWPPSPLRLFQALVDAAASRWRESQFVAYATPALEFLQKLQPSQIVVPPHQFGSTYRIAVPNNDLDVWAEPISRGKEPNKQPNELKTMKTIRPTHIRIGNGHLNHAIHYLFDLPADARQHFEALKSAARFITHLGWGIDMVAADASIISEADAAKLPGERWRPSPTGGVSLRAPIHGTLEALMKKHQAFLNRLGPDGFRPVPPLTAFRVVNYRPDSDPLSRPYAAFRFLDPETGERRSYPATRAVSIAGMIRGAVHEVAKNAGRDSRWISEFVCGHHDGPDSFPRFSYVPLPSIQPVVGVGHICRVLIAEPIEHDGKEVTWLRPRLAGVLAKNEQGRDALIVPLPRDDFTLKQYLRASHDWTTVTPVALPGSDDGLPSKTNKLIAKMIRHAGYDLDQLAEWPEYHRMPFRRGAEDAKRYRPGVPHHLANCTMYHMRLRWKHPMNGPIALGAGRHCGLGAFAATDD
jgi:CRISPR-associated protein Csb2